MLGNWDEGLVEDVPDHFADLKGACTAASWEKYMVCVRAAVQRPPLHDAALAYHSPLLSQAIVKCMGQWQQVYQYIMPSIATPAGTDEKPFRFDDPEVGIYLVTDAVP
jgi:hypothetical protein